MAKEMSNHIGEQFEGMVSTVTNFGMFVELDNLVEGLVHVSNMSGFYRYDEELQMLKSDRGNDFRIGDRVVVEVIRADKDERAVDFKVVKRL